MQIIEDGERRSHREQVSRRDLHDLGIGGLLDEQREDAFPEQVHGARHCDGGDGRDGERAVHAAPDARVIPRAQVLPRVGRDRVAVGHRRHLERAVELVGGGESRHIVKAQLIDDALHRHAAQRNEPVLKRHGEGEVKQHPHVPPMNAKVRARGAERFEFPHRKKAEDGSRALRDDGRARRALHAPAKAYDEQKIEPDVDEGRRDHGEKRRAAVPNGAQERGQEVEKRRHADPAEEDEEVIRGHLEHQLVRVKEPEERPDRGDARNRKKEGDPGAQQDRHRRRAAKPRRVSRAEALRDEDREPLHESDDHREPEPQRPVRRAHRAQRGDARELAHDRRVGRGIELLEHVSQHQGKREEHDVSRRAAPGHVPRMRHFIPPAGIPS